MSKTVYERFLQSLYHPEPVRDLRELVLRSARLYGKRRAFVLKNGEGALYEVSYDRLLADCRALTEALAARGLTGCRIAVTGANSYEWALAYLAAVIVGCGAAGAAYAAAKRRKKAGEEVEEPTAEPVE